MLPSKQNVEIIYINPRRLPFKLPRVPTPVLFIAIAAVIALSAMSMPKSQALPIPIINYAVKESPGMPLEEVQKPEPVAAEKQSISAFAKKNPAFPLGVKELAPESSIEYIRRYAAIAKAEMLRSGVPASISLAQGLIESRYGTSSLAVNANNHFGMKCFSKHCKKGHCVNATDDSHKDFFLKFRTAAASYRAHSELLSNSRYKKLHRYGKNYRQWAYGLKSCGYATDRTYAEKLIGTIERYELYKYDR